MYIKKLILSIGLLMAYVGTAEALTCESQSSGSWNSSNTWTNCGNGIPGSLDVVTIKDTHVVSLNVDTAELGGLTVEVGGDLNVAQRSVGFSINLHQSATQKVDLSNALMNLSAHITINARGQDIWLGGVLGRFEVHLNSDAETRLMGKIGDNNSNRPTTFVTDSPGTTVFVIANDSTGNFNTNGNVTFHDDVLILKSVLFKGGANTVVFNGTINTSNAANSNGVMQFIYSGIYTIQFNQNIGEVNELETLEVYNSNLGTVELNTPIVLIDYVQLTNVLLNSPTETVFMKSLFYCEGYIRTAIGANPNELIINSGSAFVGAIGDNNQPLSSLKINSNGTMYLYSPSVTTTLSQEYSADVNFDSFTNEIVLNSPQIIFQNNVNINDTNLTLNTTDTTGATKIEGVLSGSGNLIKNGIGTLDFYTINPLSGNVILNEGHLINQFPSNAIFPNVPLISLAANTQADLGSSSLSDEYFIGNNQSVNGNGTFTDKLRVDSGAIVSPGLSGGLSTGSLMADEINMLSGSILSIQINGNTVGSEYDQLVLSQGGSLDGATLDLSLNFMPVVGDTFKIISSSSPLTGNFAGLPEGAKFMIGVYDFAISYVAGGGNDVVLTVEFIDYTVSGTISGLVNGTLILQNNGGDDLQFTTDGPFVFSPLDDLSNFAVTVKTNPSMPNQTCLVTGGNSGQNDGTGQLAGSNYTGIVVNCITNQYSLGGSVSGLTNGTLTLQNNGGDDLQITQDGAFGFGLFDDLSNYAVTVQSNTSLPEQTCLVTGGNSLLSNGSGQIAGSDVNIVVTCSTNQYAVSGILSGLINGTLTLQNNGGDDLDLTQDGSFAFPKLDDLSNYAVTVASNTSDQQQNCFVTGGNSGQDDGTGQLAGNDSSNIVVICTSADQYTVGGTVSGLLSGSVILQNNAGNDLQVTNNGAFTFGLINDLTNYNVTVKTNPSMPNQTCLVTDGSGQLDGNDTSIAVTCTTNQYTVSGTVSGVVNGTLTLQNNAGDDLDFTQDGSFEFSPIDDFSNYAVIVSSNTNIQNQTCVITGGNSAQDDGAGQLAGANVTDIVVVCTSDNQYSVGGTVSGLTNGTLTLQNNGGDDFQLTSDGTFTFTTILNDLSNYAVTVQSNTSSPEQTCIITGGNSGQNDGTGQLAGSNIVDIVVNCSINQYSVGGTISGLSDGILTLQNNAGDDLQFFSNGAFNFTTKLDDLSVFAVTVKTNPTTPNQTCLITGGNSGQNDGTGQLAGSDYTGIVVICTTTQYSIAGTVSGLLGGTLILQNNAGNDLPLSSDGLFEFTTKIDDFSHYAVTVKTNPNVPKQTCSVTSGSNVQNDGTGQLAGSDYADIVVTCAINQYSVGGTLSGLINGTLTLQNNTGNDLQLSSNGAFEFTTMLDDLSSYAVILTNNISDPQQNCVVTGGNSGQNDGAGDLAGHNYIGINVLCEVSYHVDMNAQAGGDGYSWDTAFNNLQDALELAISGDEIWVAKGVYYPDVGGGYMSDDRTASFTLIDGVSIYGGFDGTETDLDQRDPTLNVTILSGDIGQDDDNSDGNFILEDRLDAVGLNSFNIIYGADVVTSTVFSGFTVTAGQADGMSGTIEVSGAGMFCGSLNGFPQYRPDFSGPIISESTFIGNSASKKGAATLGCSQDVRESNFINNYSDGSSGAVNVSGGYYENVLFQGNTSQSSGGALSIIEGSITIINSKFISNHSEINGDGGAIWSNSPITLENTLFSGNKSSGEGGAIRLLGNNTQNYTNVTMTGNSASEQGGAIKLEGGVILNLRNSIIWNNHDNTADTSVTSSIFNQSGAGVYRQINSLVQNYGTDGVGNLDEDPLFITDADPITAPNSLGDARLMGISIAINAGDNSFVTTDTDLGGIGRIFNGTVDMGAYESFELIFKDGFE